MSRTYCGTAAGGTTPDSSIAAGSIAAAVSIVTMSPELMVSTGLTFAAKWPTCTVCGLGISVYSADWAGEPSDSTAMVAATARQYEILDAGLAMHCSLRGRWVRIVARVRCTAIAPREELTRTAVIYGRRTQSRR